MKEITNWCIREWFDVFLFGAFFAVVFQDVRLMGWFVAGSIVGKALW